MAAKQINYYVENKYTEDIVYTYNNGEEDRYRKTKQGVLLIHKSKSGRITERMLADFEFSLDEFARMKAFFDEHYRERNKGDVVEHRNTVSLTDLEETRICSHELSAEDEYLKTVADEYGEEDYRTLENAIVVMNACLSETQKSRMKMYFLKRRSMDEIAEIDGTYHNAVRKSIRGAEKKI